MASGSAGSTAVSGPQLDGQPALARTVAGRRDRSVQAADRHARGEVLQARAHDAVRRAHRLAQARAALSGRSVARLGVQQRDLALGQREILRQAIVDLGRQAQALALEGGARDALAQAAQRRCPAPSRSPRMASTVALVSSRAKGWRCAAATTPRTSPPASSGSTSQAEAGESNGLATSQVAGSWKPGAPAGRGQPPCLLLEAQLVEQADAVDVRARRRRSGAGRHVISMGR